MSFEVVSIPNTGLRALTAGPRRGPLALCLHGFPDTPHTWAQPLAQLAAQGFRAVAPWLRGYAPSVRTGPFDLPSLVDDVEAILDALAPRAPVHLVGHDWGALVAYEAALRMPSRIARMVAIAVPHPRALVLNAWRAPAQLVRSRYIGFFQLGALAEQAVAADDFAYIRRLWRRWSPGLAPDPQHLDAVIACLRVSLPSALAYYRTFRSREVRRGFRQRWFAGDARLRVPTTYLHGTEDGCMSAALAVGQERLYDAPFEYVPVAGAGHFAHLERPEVLAEVIARWAP